MLKEVQIVVENHKIIDELPEVHVRDRYIVRHGHKAVDSVGQVIEDPFV